MSAGRLTGARVLRVEDPRLLRGEAVFTADITVPGQRIEAPLPFPASPNTQMRSPGWAFPRGSGFRNGPAGPAVILHRA